VGSGEYLPVLSDVEDWLFAGNERIYVQLATAAAPEGDGSLARWHDLGRQAAERLGAEQVIVDIRTREDAMDARWVPLIERAGLIYLSGGNPTFLAKILRDTPAWEAIRRTWLRPGAAPVEGLGVVPDARILPHFDRYTRWLPDMALRPFVSHGGTVLGIDEDTALVGEDPGETGPWSFSVRGRQDAYVVTRDGAHSVRDGIDLVVHA